MLEKNHLFAPNFWVYILLCRNNSLYTGYTNNLISRYHAHINGTAAKYTRSFRAFCVVGVWPSYGTKSEAMQIERFIKKMDKNLKQQLIDNPAILETLFA